MDGGEDGAGEGVRAGWQGRLARRHAKPEASSQSFARSPRRPAQAKQARSTIHYASYFLYERVFELRRRATESENKEMSQRRRAKISSSSCAGRLSLLQGHSSLRTDCQILPLRGSHDSQTTGSRSSRPEGTGREHALYESSSIASIRSLTIIKLKSCLIQCWDGR